MLTGDIKSNQYRVHSLFAWLDATQDREDMLFILKKMAAEESLQFEELSEPEQMDLPTIALVIKYTTVGQGLKFLLQKLTDLKQQLHIWLKKDIPRHELLKRNGISLEQYTNFKKDNNIL